MTGAGVIGDRGMAGEAGPPGWVRGVAAGLEAAGLTVLVGNSGAAWDITAVAQRPGGREAEVVIDDDGYTEVRYWNAPGASPARVVGIITGALAVVHGGPGDSR